MIVSRMIAKQRMAANVRPSFVGAWGLVLADAVIVALLVYVTFPLFHTWFTTNEPSVPITIALVVIVFFIPSQACLIVSALWAAKSRWLDSQQAD